MNNIKKRIVISFLANSFRGVSTVLVGILLARFLGSQNYGELLFLIASSMAVKQLLDFGSSSAFFTFLSQETRPAKFLAQFWIFFFGKYVLSILVIIFILPDSLKSNIFMGNSSMAIIIAIVTIALQSDFWPVASQILESQRKTILAQLIFVFSQLIQLAFIIGSHYLGFLSVVNYLIFIGILWFIAGLMAIIFYDFTGYIESKKSKSISIKDYLKYCLPIAPIIFISFIAEFLDKWMLQNYGGSSQQAFLAVSVQVASLSLLLTATFIKIFWKEVAEALHHNRIQSAITIYCGARRIVFFISALISGACIPWTSQILFLLYGKNYILAEFPLVFLMLYSIHQSIGQVDSVFLLASSKTRVGLKMSILLMPLGILMTFIFLSNPNIFIWGLGLGATGLAIKMVVSQLISVNVMGYLIQKEFGIKFTYLDQIQVICVFVALGFLVKLILLTFFALEQYLFILGICLYFFAILLLARFSPGIICLPSDWVQILRKYLPINLSN